MTVRIHKRLLRPPQPRYSRAGGLQKSPNHREVDQRQRSTRALRIIENLNAIRLLFPLLCRPSAQRGDRHYFLADILYQTDFIEVYPFRVYCNAPHKPRTVITYDAFSRFGLRRVDCCCINTRPPVRSRAWWGKHELESEIRRIRIASHRNPRRLRCFP